MNVLNPGFLALAALAVPLIALYILKLRRRDVRISSTLLWEQAVRDMQANAPFQRLRANLLLLLQLLLLALLVFALARPALRRQASPGSVVVLVVDTSASMGAVEAGRSRLELALEAARGTLERLGETDEAMVVEAWSGASVVAGFSRDRTAAMRALESLRVRDTATRPADALLLAATAIEKRDGARILFFSDGACAGIPAHPVLETSLTWVRTGESAGNTGITAFRAEVVLGPDGVVATRASGGRTLVPCSVFAAISNFTPARRQTYATLKAGGEVVGVRAVDAGAGETVGVSFEAALPAGEA
ncbi:MAG: VWA domain-containing protein, partial [Candidatus Brocadiae bacterium]|nr:VWA domain-containing protein [Candidatus Brocadiia bacterium]